jgi:hypothetical protein
VLAQVAASAVVQHSAAKSREHLAGNGDQGHLEGDPAAMLMTLAPILISFSFRLNSDQRLISSSVASVRRKAVISVGRHRGAGGGIVGIENPTSSRRPIQRRREARPSS